MVNYLSIGTFVKRLILKNQLEALANSPVRYCHSDPSTWHNFWGVLICRVHGSLWQWTSSRTLPSARRSSTISSPRSFSCYGCLSALSNLAGTKLIALTSLTPSSNHKSLGALEIQQKWCSCNWKDWNRSSSPQMLPSRYWCALGKRCSGFIIWNHQQLTLRSSTYRMQSGRVRAPNQLQSRPLWTNTCKRNTNVSYATTNFLCQLC